MLSIDWSNNMEFSLSSFSFGELPKCPRHFSHFFFILCEFFGKQNLIKKFAFGIFQEREKNKKKSRNFLLFYLSRYTSLVYFFGWFFWGLEFLIEFVWDFFWRFEKFSNFWTKILKALRNFGIFWKLWAVSHQSNHNLKS